MPNLTTLYLVRHGMYAEMGRVFAGRMGGIELDRQGRAQSQHLARWLTRQRLTRIQSSPRRRARQTAEPIGQRAGRSVEVVAALDEINAGEWTGKTFEDLRADPRWHSWNNQRGQTGIPGGETMVQLQARILRHIERFHCEKPGGAVVMVSHAEVIRAAVLHYAGLPPDAFEKVEIDAASVTTVVVAEDGASLLAVNEQIDEGGGLPIWAPRTAMEA